MRSSMKGLPPESKTEYFEVHCTLAERMYFEYMAARHSAGNISQFILDRLAESSSIYRNNERNFTEKQKQEKWDSELKAYFEGDLALPNNTPDTTMRHLPKRRRQEFRKLYEKQIAKKQLSKPKAKEKLKNNSGMPTEPATPEPPEEELINGWPREVEDEEEGTMLFYADYTPFFAIYYTVSDTEVGFRYKTFTKQDVQQYRAQFLDTFEGLFETLLFEHEDYCDFGSYQSFLNTYLNAKPTNKKIARLWKEAHEYLMNDEVEALRHGSDNEGLEKLSRDYQKKLIERDTAKKNLPSSKSKRSLL